MPAQFYRVLLIYALIYWSIGSINSQYVSGDQLSEVDSLFTLIETGEAQNLEPDQIISISEKYFLINPELSNAYGELALNMPFAIENSSFKIEALLNHGYNLNKQGNYVNALIYLNEALELSDATKNDELLVRAYNSLGIYYNDRGDNVVSSDFYLKSLHLSREISDTLGMIRPLVNLSGIYMDQGRPEKAIEYAEEGLVLSRASKSTRGETYLLNNLAIAYNASGELDIAKNYLENALEISYGLKDEEAKARNHSNLCDNHTQKKEFEQARFHCLKADSLLSLIDSPRSQLLFSLTFGDYYIATGQTNNAIQMADKALSIAQESAFSVHIGDVYDLYHMAYEQQGKYKEALEMYQKYWDLRHGGLSNKRIKEINQAEISYLKLLEDNETLKQESEMNELKIEALESKDQRNILALSAFGLLAIFGITYRNLRIKNRTNKLLRDQKEQIESKNKIIDKALKEKETLLKEIHHRVKNNLQIISSLLNLQSRKIDDAATLASIKEGKNRVEAMSLIHQNLYQNENLTSLNMQVYFTQLLGNLSKSLKIPDKTITYEVEAEDVEMDIDTAIPLGLIVNELVSNSYEHAFVHKESGHIEIGLKSVEQHTHFELRVRDTGAGFPSDFEVNKSKSLGMKLVYNLGTRQLKGDIQVLNENGSEVILTFPLRNKQL